MNRLKKQLIELYEKIFPIVRWEYVLTRYRFNVLSSLETIQYIKEHGCSVARFGDGEFGIMMNTNHPDFQNKNAQLSTRLAEIAKYKGEDILVCIPHNFKNINDCNDFAFKFWNWWLWNDNNLVNAAKIMNLKWYSTRVFGDAQVTRPYMDWKDKKNSKAIFEGLRSIWNNKNVLLIEGSKTKMGINNPLLNNVSSIKRLICPAQNAFDKYEQILNAALDILKRNNIDLTLICLGPTATVLAYDLGKTGYQAIDIGHLDIEYEWFLANAASKLAVVGKYTQEAHNSTANSFDDDKEYNEQIVLRIE